jgi:hypothetical protein
MARTSRAFVMYQRENGAAEMHAVMRVEKTWKSRVNEAIRRVG